MVMFNVLSSELLYGIEILLKLRPTLISFYEFPFDAVDIFKNGRTYVDPRLMQCFHNRLGGPPIFKPLRVFTLNILI